jgi:hypothetical protein
MGTRKKMVHTMSAFRRRQCLWKCTGRSPSLDHSVDWGMEPSTDAGTASLTED